MVDPAMVTDRGSSFREPGWYGFGDKPVREARTNWTMEHLTRTSVERPSKLSDSNDKNPGDSSERRKKGGVNSGPVCMDPFWGEETETRRSGWVPSSNIFLSRAPISFDPNPSDPGKIDGRGAIVLADPKGLTSQRNYIEDLVARMGLKNPKTGEVIDQGLNLDRMLADPKVTDPTIKKMIAIAEQINRLTLNDGDPRDIRSLTVQLEDCSDRIR